MQVRRRRSPACGSGTGGGGWRGWGRGLGLHGRAWGKAPRSHGPGLPPAPSGSCLGQAGRAGRLGLEGRERAPPRPLLRAPPRPCPRGQAARAWARGRSGERPPHWSGPRLLAPSAPGPLWAGAWRGLRTAAPRPAGPRLPCALVGGGPGRRAREGTRAGGGVCQAGGRAGAGAGWGGVRGRSALGALTGPGGTSKQPGPPTASRYPVLRPSLALRESRELGRELPRRTDPVGPFGGFRAG